MTENATKSGLAPCRVCTAPVRLVRVKSVATVAEPMSHDTIRVCTNPDCDSKKPERAITDVV